MTDWRPPSEIPPLGTLALIAIPTDEHGNNYRLMGIYERVSHGWHNDSTGGFGWPYAWWCTEADLIAHLMPRVKLRSNGHG